MQKGGQDLSDRLLNFAAACVRLSNKLDPSYAHRHIGNQLLRAATSCGANYQEACAAESRADFIHKMQIVLKELRESLYWLKLLERLEFSPDFGLSELLKEADELIRIFSKSVVTAKSNVG